jgi:hypothetical protein
MTARYIEMDEKGNAFLKPLNKIEFDKLSIDEKRIAICQDVIARINSSNIQPIHGDFFQNRRNDCEVEDEGSVQEKINNGKCLVCAKGALFCSWVGNFNNVDYLQFNNTCEDVNSLRNSVPELVEIFGVEMLDNIEAAHESDTYSWHYDNSITKLYSVAFAEYSLSEIMQYIIDNNGEFLLPADYIPA